MPCIILISIKAPRTIHLAHIHSVMANIEAMYDNDKTTWYKAQPWVCLSFMAAEHTCISYRILCHVPIASSCQQWRQTGLESNFWFAINRSKFVCALKNSSMENDARCWNVAANCITVRKSILFWSGVMRFKACKIDSVFHVFVCVLASLDRMHV